jgi:hypothetical protein
MCFLKEKPACSRPSVPPMPLLRHDLKNAQNISGMPMQSHYELYTIAAHCAIGYQRHIFWGCTQESAQMHTVRIKLSLMREGMRFMKKIY